MWMLCYIILNYISNFDRVLIAELNIYVELYVEYFMFLININYDIRDNSRLILTPFTNISLSKKNDLGFQTEWK